MLPLALVVRLGKLWAVERRLPATGGEERGEGGREQGREVGREGGREGGR